MNRQILICSILALCLIGGSAVVLHRVGAHQALAAPGVRTHSLPGSIRLQAELPQQVLDYDSELQDTDEITLSTLPSDTSFGQRRYHAPDGFGVDLRVVLMGRDRTSMHKPQLCLTGQGWQIDDRASAETQVRIQQPYEYNLPVVKLVAHSAISSGGQSQLWSGVYVYWYVADDALSASTSGLQRMYWMASKLLRTGILQRWAYVSCFARCLPGQENATFERMKPFIAAAVPQFQLYPRPNPVTLTATQ